MPLYNRRTCEEKEKRIRVFLNLEKQGAKCDFDLFVKKYSCSPISSNICMIDLGVVY